MAPQIAAFVDVASGHTACSVHGMRLSHALTCSSIVLALIGCGSNDDSTPANATSSTGSTTAASSSSTGGTGGGATGAGGMGGVDPCVDLAAQFQQALDDGRESAKSPGAVAAVITPDCGRWVGASGQSTDTDPMDPAYALRIGSVTKTFVASSILELTTEGKLGLDDPLETWVPGVPDGATITVRNLLNHTSGIFNYTEDAAWVSSVQSQPMKVWAPQELVDVATAHPANFAPGESWAYSNTNYILLGMVVEAASGEQVGAVVRKRLLDPTKLAGIFFDGEEPVTIPMGHGFAANKEDLTSVFDPSYAWAAGAMVASAGDLADWAVALYGGSVLPAASLDQMLETVDTGTPGLRYGLGVMEFSPQIAGTLAYGHDGAIPGYQTQMVYLVEPATAIVSIVNIEGASPNDITLNMLNIVLGP